MLNFAIAISVTVIVPATLAWVVFLTLHRKPKRRSVCSKHASKLKRGQIMLLDGKRCHRCKKS